MAAKFDYVIVGAGAAGCVLASRLTVDPRTNVLLLEAGPDHPPGREPSSIRDPYPVSLGDPRLNWPDLTAEVGADLGNGEARFSRHYLQGYGVGGGSNIQGMVALRGYPEDYDQWRDCGALGWGWEGVLPFFRRLERDLDFDGPSHGQDGHIPIRRIRSEHWASFSRVFAECAMARGFPMIEDLNADFRAGVGPLPMANLPDQRVSAAMGYLNPEVRRRRNLVILPNAFVERVERRGRTVVGVAARTLGRLELFTGEEVILSAGAIYSPAILMRSGIGPVRRLRELGIEVACDLPGVGQHLMNHVGLSVPVYLPKHAVQPRTQRGLGQSCLRLSSGVEGPENDIILVPINKTAWHPLGRRVGALVVEVHRTHSRGEVTLRSPDPAIEPEVKFNLLSDVRDLARLTVGLRLCLEILIDPRMRAISNESFLHNAKMVQSLWRRSAQNWLRASAIATSFQVGAIRRKLIARSRLDPQALMSDPLATRQLALQRANPPHHVSGTCRMGRPGDTGVVVDSKCQVLGIENLRVIDASVMPTLVRANTHIPVLMIAEKLADVLQRGARD